MTAAIPELIERLLSGEKHTLALYDYVEKAIDEARSGAEDFNAVHVLKTIKHTLGGRPVDLTEAADALAFAQAREAELVEAQSQLIDTFAKLNAEHNLTIAQQAATLAKQAEALRTMHGAVGNVLFNVPQFKDDWSMPKLEVLRIFTDLDAALARAKGDGDGVGRDG